ncbi:MAG: extracellular solute-binding protein [Gammaproteobacteria bacterium]
MLLSACSIENGDALQQESPLITHLEVWAHDDNGAGREAMQKQVERFNEQHPRLQISAKFIPSAAYHETIESAANSGKLPEILELDGPFVYRQAWLGRLVPLDKHLTENTRRDLLPSVIQQGLYHGRLYSLATCSSGIVLFARKSDLVKLGVRIPSTIDDAWTVDEFNQIMLKSRMHDTDGAVIDLKIDGGEWITRAFLPVITSAGGDLIERENYQHAEGYLNHENVIAAFKHIQSWVNKGLVDSNSDNRAFSEGRVVFSWADYRDYLKYKKQFGDDLVMLPLPDFGQGSRSAAGGWGWSITRNSQFVQEAMRFIEYLYEEKEMLVRANETGSVPATYSAVGHSDPFAGKTLSNLSVKQLDAVSSVRPQTAAYPVITAAFQNAFDEIIHHSDVKKSLDKAVRIIERDISDHQDYKY